MAAIAHTDRWGNASAHRVITEDSNATSRGSMFTLKALPAFALPNRAIWPTGFRTQPHGMFPTPTRGASRSYTVKHVTLGKKNRALGYSRAVFPHREQVDEDEPYHVKTSHITWIQFEGLQITAECELGWDVVSENYTSTSVTAAVKHLGFQISEEA